MFFQINANKLKNIVHRKNAMDGHGVSANNHGHEKNNSTKNVCEHNHAVHE
jgi:hypothetical protein